MWHSSLICLRIVVLSIATSASVLITWTATTAQTTSFQSRPAQAVAANAPDKSQPAEVRKGDLESEVKDRVNALEESLRMQNTKLEAMEKIIAEQQRMIEALSGKTANAATTKVVAAEPVVGAATAKAQTLSLDERLKKVEGQVAKIGPFKLSGDFRLRFDSILRKAENRS